MSQQTKTGARITHIRTVAVPVTDQDRALEFYVHQLGFEKRIDGSYGGGQRWIEVGPPAGSTTIALVRRDDGQGAGVDTGIRLATEDAARLHADLRARALDVDPAILRWPGVPPMFLIRDPDGNSLVIVEEA